MAARAGRAIKSRRLGPLSRTEPLFARKRDQERSCTSRWAPSGQPAGCQLGGTTSLATTDIFHVTTSFPTRTARCDRLPETITLRVSRPLRLRCTTRVLLSLAEDILKASAKLAIHTDSKRFSANVEEPPRAGVRLADGASLNRQSRFIGSLPIRHRLSATGSPSCNRNDNSQVILWALTENCHSLGGG